MDVKLKKRIYCFDLLKIFSIIAIFFHHIMMDLYVVHPMHDLKFLMDIIIRPNMNLGMIACGLFILLSGATLALKEKEEEPIDFYKKRLIRVLIPFYITYIMYFFIKAFIHKTIHMFNGLPKWRFIFTVMGMDEYLSANGVATFSLGIGEWFLGCIILCYLTYPFLYKLHKKNKLITFCVMTIYYLLININYNKFSFVIPSHMNFFCQIYNFYIGMVLMGLVNNYNKKLIAGNLGISEEKHNLYKKLLFIISTIVVLFLFIYTKMINIPDNIKTTLAIVALFVMAYLLEEMIEKIKYIGNVIVFFNKISLEIYLVHHFIIYEVDFLLSYRRLNGITTLLVIVFDFTMTILFAILVEKLSGKITSLVNEFHK